MNSAPRSEEADRRNELICGTPNFMLLLTETTLENRQCLQELQVNHLRLRRDAPLSPTCEFFVSPQAPAWH